MRGDVIKIIWILLKIALNYVRDFIPNKKSIKHLTQADTDLMFSHINSTPRASLNGKTPYEAFEFSFSFGRYFYNSPI